VTWRYFEMMTGGSMVAHRGRARAVRLRLTHLSGSRAAIWDAYPQP
jgi:hypothetical protein